MNQLRNKLYLFLLLVALGFTFGCAPKPPVVVKSQMLIDGGSAGNILIESIYDEQGHSTLFANEQNSLPEGIWPARLVTTFDDGHLETRDFKVDYVIGKTQRLFRFEIYEIKCPFELGTCWGKALRYEPNDKP